MTQVTQPAQQALAKRPVDLRQMLEMSKGQIELALPRHLTAERMIRVAMTAYQKTPDLQKCPMISIVGAVVQASQLGLEPDGILGQAYLVPFYNSTTGQKECQLQIGYRGFIALARRSGEVSNIYAELVYQCDKFEVTLGTDKRLVHEPNFQDETRESIDDKGEPIGLIGAYAVVKYKDGEADFEYMSKIQLDKIRSSSKAKSSKSPWFTHPLEMYRKCPIRRLAKRLPLSPEFMKAAVLDEYADAGVHQHNEAEVDAVAELARVASQETSNALAEKYAGAANAESEPEVSAEGTKEQKTNPPQAEEQQGKPSPTNSTGSPLPSLSPTQQVEHLQTDGQSAAQGRVHRRTSGVPLNFNK